MTRIELWVPRFVVALVLMARLTSLFTGDAPSSRSSFETCAWVATLPGSAVTLLVEGMNRDSLALWVIVALLWATATYLQFIGIAALPRILSSRPLANRIFTGIAAGGVLLAGFWAISRIPSHPEEEATSFFVAVPLLFCVAFAVLLALSVAARSYKARV
jgi:hypothetical protein